MSGNPSKALQDPKTRVGSCAATKHTSASGTEELDYTSCSRWLQKNRTHLKPFLA
jgi:hypothetical protein